MGHTRVDTIKRVLTSPPEQEEEIISRFAADKERKQAVYFAHGLLEPGDTFESAEEIKEELRDQVLFARGLVQPGMREVLDKSPLGLASTSDALRKILALSERMDRDEEPLQRIELYSRAAAFLLSDTCEPAIKNIAVETLKDAYDEHSDVDADAAARQIAVGLSLHFKGTPKDTEHRQKVEALIDSHFCGEASILGVALKKMLQAQHLEETARLLSEKRLRDLEKAYASD